ncbi:MAG TPA: L,D-transpeptidase [Pyrinomonadaceae bacterium]|nr:L,D-transpeptidase [Pyrinomonadaceae bacterium]
MRAVRSVGLIVAVVAALASGGYYATERAELRRAAVVEETAVRTPLKLPLARPRIVVEKAARRLTLYAGDDVARVYRVGLGTSPVGDKVRAGDMRTPEGDFYVCVKNERSAFYLSLGISYPDARAAERGLRDGLITRAQYRRIVNAVRRKQTPPWNTALGGEIFIHGRGASSDWTWGCIALEDADIKELFDAVPVGTPVRIEP